MSSPGEKPLSSSSSFQFVDSPNYTEVGKPPHRTDTFNVVICGEAGSGKSSLVNLIAGTNIAVTSSDAGGCTAGTNAYDITMTRDETFKVKLVDTAGLDEGPRGTVPDKEARRILRKLLRTLTEQGNIQLVMYCVRGERVVRTLRRNYELIRSQVKKKKVPIVLVVTCLESYKPEMEDWWAVNERTISNLGMTFAGHACITTETMTSMYMRRAQSYDAVCKLIEQRYLSNNTGIHTESSRGTIHNVLRTKRNTIVVFGETGAGKSSLINLMAGNDVAGTSCGIEACTTHWKEYPLEFDGEPFKLFDTVGLDEPQLGIPQYFDAVENAYNLIQKLEREGGIDLLLFCMPAGRLKIMHQRNYQLFRHFLCYKKVPIVLAITNLEREKKNMESWWTRNQEIFRKKKIRVDGHACITAIEDDHDPTFQKKSRDAIWDLVRNVAADGQKRAQKGGNDLFVSLMPLAGNGNLRVGKDIVSRLTKRCHMPPEVAKEIAGRIKKDVVEGASGH
ncbi:P-loop containing nucleoside triphosphate hydrolase protein [Suillus subaureus]|uniref:P-loop containing nucleoside triphosphate hydrolase protein n=1 Tax=Suillus subaureus TaxID=48587 RepID=A0A9P7JD17_9AGAM|nr:P-loop containing nucleoside triphosphate hydrolase protein [Suillus subaureus]KAG1815219.1 P-loop containing nucleoside triphosphate hydrolase protein [Suillus subaureus]